MADRLVDGRCPWGASTPDYVAYHDEEWGKPVRDDQGLYERMCLEAFQSGLSWLTILRKRENFRANAKVVADMERAGESLAELLWSFAPEERPAPRTFADVPAVTPESKAMAKELKRRGFRFVGPTTAYAMMQACGLVDDHIEGCLVPTASRGSAVA